MPPKRGNSKNVNSAGQMEIGNQIAKLETREKRLLVTSIRIIFNILGSILEHKSPAIYNLTSL